VFFEKFIEQHRVDRVVANCERLPVAVENYEIRIHFRHVLCDQSELRDSSGIDVVLVAKGHRLEREDRFARLVHRSDVLFETLGGGGYAKLAISIYDNWGTCNGCSADSRNKRGGL